MEKRTNISDIAKALNLTKSTVSRALNNVPTISDQTRRLVLETAKKMNYRPNKLASSLSNGRTNIIGVIIPDAKIEFFSKVIASIEQTLKQKGYSILLYQSNESLESEITGITSMLEAQVDGFIISMSLETNSFEHFEKLIEENKPLILFDRIQPSIDCSSVSIDDYKAGYIVTKHLLDQGYKNIASISTHHKVHIFNERFRGYVDAMKESGINIKDEYQIFGELSPEGGIAATRQLLSMSIKPDAIIGGDDYVALGVLKELKSQNIIPPQKGIIGFSNQLFGQYLSPSLSTLDQKPEIVGEKSAELLLEHLNSKVKLSAKKIVIEPELIVRESSRRDQNKKNFRY
ncbi:LacI family DNA-binding transcriptional regulator [Sphingobacterium sp. 18053]|uniref:LacI family DNA-binding transcriptional regulator n=1 Tax=Sphingobacterium sp. 18053 TaxID=2681401 RepID=UPI00135BB26E|nr:LacI family DNA-binding transcriptional regulator [Sphingobacterium sp. 18053]